MIAGRLALSCALALASAGCSGEGPAVRQGERPAIVSLNPCTDAMLAEVALPGQILALSHYSRDPRASSMDVAIARRFGTTGGTVEEVLALRPDLVVAGDYLGPAARNAFSRLGIRVETFGVARSVAESEAQVARIARLAGHPGRGAALNARIEAALARTEAPADAARPTALVWQQDGIVAGPDSLVARLLAHAGFTSHAAMRGLGQGAYLPLERVLSDPPDVILAAGGERALTHPALRALKGTRYERFDPSLLYCGGPTIIRAAGRLADIRASLRRAGSA